MQNSKKKNGRKYIYNALKGINLSLQLIKYAIIMLELHISSSSPKSG